MPSLSLILTILIVIIMFFSLLKGFIVGYKKNIYHLASRILFWVLFFVITGLIVKPTILDSESLYLTISSVVGLPNEYSTLSQYLVSLIASAANVSQESLSDPAIYNTILAAMYSIVKIAFLIVFAILWAIISTIIYHIFFKKICQNKVKGLEKLKAKQEKLTSEGKEDKNLQKKIERGEKKQKHIMRNKLIGIGTGFVNGAMSVFLIMSLINSIVLILPDLSNKDNINASTETNTSNYNSIYDYIVEKYPSMQGVVDYIADYQKSNLMGITALKINGKRADTLFIDAIISGKSNNYTVAIREEMQSVVEIAVYAFSLTNGFNMESVDFASLNASQQEDLKNILLVLSNDNLVKNLASAVVGVALTMDSVKEYIPEDIDLSTLSSIDWDNELKSIANMVSDVYSLQKDAPTNLKSLDINSLDADKVESLLSSFASLQTFQIAAKVGSYYAVDNYLCEKDANGNITNKEQLDSIKEKLADVVWEEDVKDLSTLYRKYEDIAIAMNESKGDDGKVNVIKGLTLTKSEDFNQVVDTILETTFMMNTFGDIIDIVKRKYIPEEYADLISPNITQSTQFSGELKTLFTLIKDISENGKNDITKLDSFNFASLNNISTETIMNSELLTYAMINIFITSSNGNGIAGNVLGEYVSVPDTLQEDLVKDANGYYHYNNQWYDTKDASGNVISQGELHIMLDTLKNVASQVKTLKYPMTTLPEILEAIDSKQMTNSKVLHYTLSKYILNNSGDFISVPVSAIDKTLTETVNGKQVDVIKRQEIENLINVLTNQEIIDSKQLLKYYLLDDDGNKTDVEIKYSDIDEKTNYMAEIAIDNPEVVLSAFLSDSLIQNDDNLNTLFASSILRTTISSFVNKYDEYITVPLSVTASTMEDVYSKDENEENPSISISKLRVLSTKECKNLLKTLSKLDIKFDNLDEISKDPMSLIDKFSTTNELNEKVYNENLVKSIFDTTHSEYSEIMHATFSKYIKDFASTSTSSFTLVIPDEVMTLPTGFEVPTGEESKTYDYISSDEVVNLIKAVYYISSSSSSIFESDNFDLYETFIDNDNVKEAFDSQIIKASISKYIQENDSTKDFIVIPTVDNVSVVIAHEDGKEMKVLTTLEFYNLIDGLKSLQRNTGLTSDNLFDINMYSLNAINASMDELIESEVLHYSISKKILELDTSTGFTLVIPNEVVNNGVMSKEEIKALVNTIDLLAGNTTIDGISSSLSYDEALDKFENATTIDEYFDSMIIRASISNYLSTIGEGVVIPYKDQEVNQESINYKDNSAINVITKQEMVSLIDMYKTIKNVINEGKADSEKLTGQDALKVNNINMESLYNIIVSKENANYKSKIFQASISDKLFASNKDDLFIGIEGNYYNEQGDLLVEGNYNENQYYYVNYDEIVKLFQALKLIAGDSTYDNLASSFDSTNIFSLDINKFFESDIMVSTMATKVYDMFNASSSALTFLDSNNMATQNEPHTYNRYNLPRKELINFYNAVLAFQNGNDNIDNISIDFDNIINKCQTDDSLIETLCNSYLMNYNVIKYIKEQNASTFNNMLILDDYSHDEHTHEYSYYWYNEENKKGDLEQFLKSLVEIYNNEEYKTALTDPTNDSISIKTFANATFINIMTNDKVLCDSLPNIIKQLSAKLKNNDLNTDLLFIPDRFADSANYNYSLDSQNSINNWKSYWKGDLENCQDGQLYLFFEAIDAGNTLSGNVDEQQLKALIASDITRPMAKDYLKQIATTFNASASILGKEPVTIPNDDDPNDKWYQLILDLKDRLS